ncbi:hypothetical protein BHE74_00017859 [Ensete ventricosum]|nr:hypothetical protein GW17_00024644 [Ensete ventricosum]RWW74214.1 hypothetical protein BHE74_00017859 [Ensete ventricosum]RZR87848.1 hypothetical protein BHM03_00015339 [Ensete ventricosum]
MNRLQDVSGYEVALAVKDFFASSFRGRTLESELVGLMVKHGRNGMSLSPTVSEISDRASHMGHLLASY